MTTDEPRYWLRHPSLSGLIGPLRRGELEVALRNGSLPRDSEVLLDEGQDRAAAAASVGWRPAAPLLGLSAPPSAAAGATAPPPPVAATDPLRQLRERTAYAPLRTLVDVLMWLAVLYVSLAAIGALSVAGGGGEVALLLIGWVLELLVVLVVRFALQAFADLADCALADRRGR